MERLPEPPAVLATLVPTGTFSSSSLAAAAAAVSNLGLHNQLVGLRWIAENIGHFCGNKDSVTIFGNSAGSKAVSGLLLSPLSAELFSRAILQSGMLLLAPNVEEALENVAKIAAYFPGCPPEEKNSETLLSGCLRRCCTEKLFNATRDSSVSLGPVYSDEVLLKRPVDLLFNKKFNTKVLLLLARLFFEKNLAFNLALCPSVCLSVRTCVSKNLFPFSDFAQTWHKKHINSNKNSGERIRVVRSTGPEIQGPEKTKIKALWKVQREENGGQ